MSHASSGKRRAALAAFLLIAAAAFAPSAVAQSGAVVAPDPAAIGLQPGGQAEAALNFSNAAGVYGVEVHLTFDPALVEVVDADPGQPGVQVAAAAWLKDGFIAQNAADNAAGKIDFAATLLNPAEPVWGSQPIFTLTLRGKAAGDGALRITSAILADRDGQAIAATWAEARLSVNASSAAPAPAAEEAAPAAAAPAPASPLLWMAAGAGALAFLGALGAFVAVLVLRLRRSRPAALDDLEVVERHADPADDYHAPAWARARAPETAPQKAPPAPVQRSGLFRNTPPAAPDERVQDRLSELVGPVRNGRPNGGPASHPKKE